LPRSNVAGGLRGQPEIEVAVQRLVWKDGDFRWQAQRFGIAPGLGDALAAAGQALQPAAMGAVGFGCGGGDLQAGIAAEGAEQDAGGLFDFGQLDRCLRVMGAGGLGDPVVPEFADEFFHDLQFPTASSSVFESAEKRASLRRASSLITQCSNCPFGLLRLTVPQAEMH
jgi:hypothetical protein